jgi:NADPH:quinone reductase-like Zn-dependent oxidoreductase
MVKALGSEYGGDVRKCGSGVKRRRCDDVVLRGGVAMM